MSETSASGLDGAMKNHPTPPFSTTDVAASVKQQNVTAENGTGSPLEVSATMNGGVEGSVQTNGNESISVDGPIQDTACAQVNNECEIGEDIEPGERKHEEVRIVLTDEANIQANVKEENGHKALDDEVGLEVQLSHSEACPGGQTSRRHSLHHNDQESSSTGTPDAQAEEPLKTPQDGASIPVHGLTNEGSLQEFPNGTSSDASVTGLDEKFLTSFSETFNVNAPVTPLEKITDPMGDVSILIVGTIPEDSSNKTDTEALFPQPEKTPVAQADDTISIHTADEGNVWPSGAHVLENAPPVDSGHVESDQEGVVSRRSGSDSGFESAGHASDEEEAKGPKVIATVDEGDAKVTEDPQNFQDMQELEAVEYFHNNNLEPKGDGPDVQVPEDVQDRSSTQEPRNTKDGGQDNQGSDDTQNVKKGVPSNQTCHGTILHSTLALYKPTVRTSYTEQSFEDTVRTANSSEDLKEVTSWNKSSQGTILHSTMALYKPTVRTPYTEEALSDMPKTANDPGDKTATACNSGIPKKDNTEFKVMGLPPRPEQSSNGCVPKPEDTYKEPVNGTNKWLTNGSTVNGFLSRLNADPDPKSEDAASLKEKTNDNAAVGGTPAQDATSAADPTPSMTAEQRRAQWSAFAAGGTPGLQTSQHSHNLPQVPPGPPPGFRNGPPPQFQQPPQQPFRNRNAPFHNNNQNYGQRPYNDNGNDFARLSAENMKLRQELAAERDAKRNLHTTIEAEMKITAEAVMQSMINSAFHEKMDVARMRYALQQREIDLQDLEAKAVQAEIFLALGQKALRSHAGYEVSFDDAEMENVKSKIAGEFALNYKLANAKLTAKFEEVKIREDEVARMKANWMLHHKEDVSASVREEMEEEIEGRLAEVADMEYKRGLEHGLEQRHAEELRRAREEGYLEAMKAREAQDENEEVEVEELIPGELAGDVGNGGSGHASDHSLIDL